MTNFMINNMTDAWKTGVNLLNILYLVGYVKKEDCVTSPNWGGGGGAKI